MMGVKRLLSILHISDGRSMMVGKNIVRSICLKAISIICSLIVVPITLHYLTDEEYGIWLTLSSILMWFSFFDVGLGNGLRNYLAQSISKNDWSKGRSYLSTTLFLLLIIVGALFILAMIIVPLLDWNVVLNTTVVSSSSLRNIVIVATLFTLINFVVKNVGVVFMSLQKYAMNDLLQVLGNLLALLVIYMLTRYTSGSLLYVTLAFTISPVLVFCLFSVPLFIKYPQLTPTYSSVDLSMSSQLLGKGLNFFVIQLTSCLVIFGAANLFIAQYCGPQAVTVYNIAYKYFNILAMGFTILISPLWNAYTDAYVKDDMNWISHTFKRVLWIWVFSVFGGGIMLLFSSFFYSIWVGHSVEIPHVVSLSVLIYLCLFNLNNCATYLLNGLNMIRVQLYTSVFVTVIYLLIVRSAGVSYGVVGISLCMSLCYALQCIVHLFQCYLIIRKKAKGIWIK